MKYFRFPPQVYDQARTFEINYTGQRTEEERLKYPSNFIKTSRYTLITFLPVSLILQFRRYANIYFLMIAIIQSIKIISPLNPFSAIAPLVFVLGLSMLREGFEDFARHRSDDEVNATPAYLHLNCKEKEKVTWAHIQVGDLILVEENQSFPADLIVLSSSIESGVCYIETSSLDGEKNLKPKSALKDTQERFSNIEHYEKLKISLDGEPPSPYLYEFQGSVHLPEKNLILGPKQLLLRGAFLRNTKWILGAVVYTGQDTRIMRNAEPARIKSSAIESTMNVLILAILIIQLILCIISASLSSAWQHQSAMKHWYLDYASEDFTPDLNSFLVFFGYFLLYNTMIPISLIVSLEFVKVFQSYFITTDEEMYVKARDKFASVKTTTINEELGQVEYIFSDKTGTLTCNQMEFKYCIIGNVLYGKQEPVALAGEKSSRVETHANNLATVHPDQIKKPDPTAPHQHSIFNFQDDVLTGVIKGKNNAGNEVRNLSLRSKDGQTQFKIDTQRDLVKYYFFLLCSAHECICQTDKNGETIYQGPSPDEITLVDAAAHMGFKFLGSSASEQTFEILGQKTKVELKFIFEFDSDRKRMSVIIRDEGVYKLLVKGADSIIKSRLDKNTDQLYLPYIEGELDSFSRIGLRCLLMATKILSEQEYKQFESACNAVVDSPNRQEELFKLTDALERDLYLIGATAVEDKLQPMVPETIADFLRANIKVWMLTGDKLETAENIAKSCRLIQGDMAVMRIAETTLDGMVRKLSDNKETFDLCVKQGRKKSLLVDGDSLSMLLANVEHIPLFVRIAQECESVVCCRVTPKQKAQVVKLIKESLNKITLAIGDGANDVNMIQEAHIGIGLFGNEGMRAVQSSDFALGEFRCLWRLLLVHGHWSYIRISEMILYFFYKNMIFTVPQFFFAFFSAFSAQSLFDDWYITFYNMLFTALPLIIRATFDQDVNYRTRATYSSDQETRRLEKKQEEYLKNKFPLLYYVGQQKTIFTIPNFIFWSFQGAIHGLIVFFGGYACFDYETVHKEGYNMGLGGFGITLLTAIIFVTSSKYSKIVDIKISLFTKFWTWLNFTSLIIFSILLYFIYMLFSQELIGTLALYTPFTLFKVAHFWLLIVILCGAVFLYDLVQGQIIRELFRSETDQLRVFVKHFQSTLLQWKHGHDSNDTKTSGEQKHLLKASGSFWEDVRKEEESYPINNDKLIDDVSNQQRNDGAIPNNTAQASKQGQQDIVI